MNVQCHDCIPACGGGIGVCECAYMYTFRTYAMLQVVVICKVDAGVFYIDI